MNDLRYPIGLYEHEGPVTDSDFERWLTDVEELPAAVRGAVSGLDPAQLDTRYRPEGWTIRQVVHHVPDSHLNGLVRFKWGLTEDVPTIKVYEEQKWAELPDALGEIEPALALLDSVNAKLGGLLRALTPEQWARTVMHPDWGEARLDWMLGLYAWHGRHHLAHITRAIEREGW